MFVSQYLSVVLATTALVSTGCAVATEAPEPNLQAGLVDSDEEFTAFQPGDLMNVLTAVQSGLWLMPTLRYQGFEGQPRLRCTAFDIDKDMFLAEHAAHVNSREFVQWTHVLYNMQINLPDEEVDDLTELASFDGDRVLFQCRADDDAGNSFAISHEMVLGVQ